MTKFLAISLVIGLLLGAVGMHVLAPTFSQPAASLNVPVKIPKYSETVRGKGFVTNSGFVNVILSDGRVLAPLSFKSSSIGWEAEIEPGVWVKGGAQ